MKAEEPVSAASGKIDVVKMLRGIANSIESGSFSATYSVNDFSGFGVPTGMHEIVIRYWNMSELAVYAQTALKMLEGAQQNENKELSVLPS